MEVILCDLNRRLSRLMVWFVQDEDVKPRVYYYWVEAIMNNERYAKIVKFVGERK